MVSSQNKRSVRLGRAGLELTDGSRVPLWSGAMHYWRVPRARWGRCLDAVRDLGFPMVESYVPWGVHERSPGKYDWTREKDLKAFVEMAGERGLKVLLRPGPHINAELIYFGFPKRIVANARMQARTARGTPVWLPAPPRSFPVPSYASHRFLREVGHWFDAFAEVALPLTCPDGPVVGVQVDNEMGFFFRTGVYDLDYCQDAVDGFRDFLRERYDGDAAALGEAWGRSGIELETVEPPRRFDATDHAGLRRHLDWLAYRDHYPRHALARMAEMLKERGFTRVPLFHNYPPSDGRPPFDYPGTERDLDFVGVDLYHQRSEYRTVKRRVLALAGSSRFPYVPELQSGAWPWWPSLQAADRNATTLTALMHGMRGANFYMLVERERWYGSPIDNDGTVREADAAWFRKLNAVLASTGLLGLRRHVRVAVICPRTYWKLADATDFMAPLTPMLSAELLPEAARCRHETFGFKRPPHIAGPEMFNAMCASLDRGGIPYDVVDSGRWDLDRYDAVLCPTLELIEAGTWKRLLGRAESGGIVVIGPEVPTLNEQLRPLQLALSADAAPYEESFGTTAAVPVGRGQVWVLRPGGADPATAAETVGTALVSERPSLLPPIRSSAPPAECSCFVDGRGAVQVVFVANPTRRIIQARLSVDPAPGETAAPALVDAFSGEAVDVSSVRLQPHEIRMLRPGLAEPVDQAEQAEQEAG